MNPSSIKKDSASDASAIRSWSESLRSDPYRAYLYSYPHKTAYRELQPRVPLSELWRGEPAETFFLYMHIPFCGARCGFCNLFTLPDKRRDTHLQYVDALERQARQWAPLVGHKPFARFAIGGGTPTLLAPELLDRLFRIAEEAMGLDPEKASISVETSPETVTAERLRILKERRVDRVSMGIQSFIEAEAAAIYRPQKPAEVERALEQLKREPFPILNLDLIYGLPGQTADSWLYSVERALSYDPEEIFLYPLYTREQTIVKPEDIRSQGQDIRMACYLAARDLLRRSGYIQYSMRRFAKEDGGSAKTILPYGCQEEGMIGLGCGARSYTRSLHYASRYAVDRQANASIIADYVAAERYDTADYGFALNEAEQKRRFLLKAVLHSEGLDFSAYKDRFGSDARHDFPKELDTLLHSGMAVVERDGLLQSGKAAVEREGLLQSGKAVVEREVLRLTDEGLAYSDAIGDWLISAEVRERMEGFEFA